MEKVWPSMFPSFHKLRFELQHQRQEGGNRLNRVTRYLLVMDSGGTTARYTGPVNPNESNPRVSRAFPEVRRLLEAWNGFPVLREVMRLHGDLGVHVAGGVVRNVLMGREAVSKDWDLFLSGPSVGAAIECFNRGGKLSTTPYGAPRWAPYDEAAGYADLMPIAGFIPGLWPCEDIVDVLNQFDFTANAVAFDLRTGQAFDPQNGARDAARRVMRMIRFDYPDGPYAAGANLDRNVVLWFRIVHYASRLGLTIEPLTRNWLLARGDQRHHAEAFEREFFTPDLHAWKTLS
ncbi:hypothetical protein [Paucibacter sp. DJ2R-2]|uniref:hypothetical protein n=1 Tax=Paucibacter sp. DJ2R-2 TaxID=2893558 RepID=UPI0021E45FF6|nr:hypothetical protein [Paucibacter sp. DJ2R-2]MCV2420238.1 hypothetical protein [Paucibacter sp. DJ4R-1]MCV2436817.1 hypothetical protein [Paucibacter sp. DJ2R-2]